MRRPCALVALICLSGHAFAHPHAWVDQQAILSLDPQSATVEYRVVPSVNDGGHMFDHLDADQDGRMSDGEKRAFATALVRSTSLTVDGRRIRLQPLNISISPRTTMTTGAGLMAVKAAGRLHLSGHQPHRVTMNVDYSRFKAGWFIQPFYSKALTRAALPTLRRSPNSQRIEIRIPDRR